MIMHLLADTAPANWLLDLVKTLPTPTAIAVVLGWSVRAIYLRLESYVIACLKAHAARQDSARENAKDLTDKLIATQDHVVTKVDELHERMPQFCKAACVYPNPAPEPATVLVRRPVNHNPATA